MSVARFLTEDEAVSASRAAVALRRSRTLGLLPKSESMAVPLWHLMRQWDASFDELNDPNTMRRDLIKLHAVGNVGRVWEPGVRRWRYFAKELPR